MQSHGSPSLTEAIVFPELESHRCVERLDATARRLFERSSVFVGGWNLEAAQQVCGDLGEHHISDSLSRLVAESLVHVRRSGDSEPRYDLVEAVREVGVKCLRESGDEPRVRKQHALYYLRLAKQAEPHLTGPEQANWLRGLALEFENLQSALKWFLENDCVEQSLRMSGALWVFWSRCGHVSEGRDILSAALKQIDNTEPAPELRAKALHGAAILANEHGDYEAACAHFESCLAIRRALGDRIGSAQVLNSWGVVARDQGDQDTARRVLDESITVSATALSMQILGNTAQRRGDGSVAQQLFDEALRMRRRLGDRHGIATLLTHLGTVAHDEGRYTEAEPLLREALDLYGELGDKRAMAVARMHLGKVARQLGDLESARTHSEYCLRISHKLGDKHHIARTLEWMAVLEVAERRHERALQLDGAARVLREMIGSPRTPLEDRRLGADLAVAHRALGKELAEAAQRTGWAHDLQEAIKLALHPRA